MTRIKDQEARAQYLAQYHSPDRIRHLHPDGFVPAAIVDWLAELKLLHDVPAHHLVPDEAMLPQESIRFFCVDSDWQHALIDGAFSIGSVTAGDQVHDAARGSHLQSYIHFRATQQRAEALSPQTRQIEADSATIAAIEEDSDIVRAKPISGFLLRSLVVSGWPGLEVDGFPEGADIHKADVDNLLKILRFERLSKNVLICLFEGVVETVMIHKPPEGLHFGVNEDEQLGIFKQLWCVKTDPMDHSLKFRDRFNLPDSDIPLDAKSVPFRNRERRVIDAAALRNQMITGFEDASKTSDLSSEEKEFTARSRENEFSSADFALQMVKGVASVEFRRKIRTTVKKDLS